MLTVCPECGLSVSDIAVICVHCGYPLKNEKDILPSKKKNHLRLPNGFGQITKIKNQSLRNPYRVMITVGMVK